MFKSSPTKVHDIYRIQALLTQATSLKETVQNLYSSYIYVFRRYKPIPHVYSMSIAYNYVIHTVYIIISHFVTFEIDVVWPE